MLKISAFCTHMYVLTHENIVFFDKCVSERYKNDILYSVVSPFKKLKKKLCEISEINIRRKRAYITVPFNSKLNIFYIPGDPTLGLCHFCVYGIQAEPL